MKKYISINEDKDNTNELHLLNDENVIHGKKIMIKDNPSDSTLSDINDIFVKKSQLTDVETIDIEKEDYTMESVANKLNDLIRALNGTTKSIVILAGLIGLNCFGATTNEQGKAKFGTLAAKDYVVVEEKDPAFNEFMEQTEYVKLGKDAQATSKSVAIGVPLAASSSWNTNFLGNVVALDRSVAIGDAAKAKNSLSIAIGNQAHVDSIHGKSGIELPYERKRKEITTLTKDNVVLNVTTNDLETITEFADYGMYEVFPYGTGEFVKDSTTISTNNENVITTKTIMLEKLYFIYEDSYADEDEFKLYNRIVSSGQGNQNLKQALYGIGIGSRAYVSGWQGLALGHYTKVPRPCSVAVGSETHVFPEGSVGLGYFARIQKSSELSMALGTMTRIPEGMKNSIVIGMPKFEPSNTNSSYKIRYNNRTLPTAMKSNSINFVYHGEGLNDFFVDNKPITDRIATEIDVIGNSHGVSKKDVAELVEEQGNLPKDNEHIVLYSSDGIRLFTREFDTMIPESQGVVTNVFINGISLDEIIRKHALNLIKDAANESITSIVEAKSMREMKAAMTNFLYKVSTTN